MWDQYQINNEGLNAGFWHRASRSSNKAALKGPYHVCWCCIFPYSNTNLQLITLSLFGGPWWSQRSCPRCLVIQSYCGCRQSCLTRCICSQISQVSMDGRIILRHFLLLIQNWSENDTSITDRSVLISSVSVPRWGFLTLCQSVSLLIEL